MGRLCSSVETGMDVKGKRVEGTNTFFVIYFEYIPKGRVKEVCYTSVLCQHRTGKSDTDRTQITICGINVRWEGNVGTNTASLELFKFVINRVLSRKGERLAIFDIGNFYLNTPMKNLNI